MKHLRFTLFFIGLLLLLNQSSVNGQDKQYGSDLIQMAIGEANKWTNTRYILYTVTGPSSTQGVKNERTFLIDKNTGNCRFEGINITNENIILLFNYKSKTTKKYFVNSQESKDNIDHLFESILNQFFIDTEILFLPALLSENPSNITDVSQKIINTDKVNTIYFTNLPTLGNNSVNGRISLTNKGEIKSIVLSNTQYNTSSSKDIGGGIFLPTVFESQSSYKFQTVAAFTDIETGKFSNP